MVKRYDIADDDDSGDVSMMEFEDGEYVTFAEYDALAARLAGTQDLYVQACEQRDDALALLTKVSLRKSCEGTQPYICHGLATARARLAEAVALLDSCEATGSEEWERRAAALVAECGPNARVTVSAEPRENDAHG